MAQRVHQYHMEHIEQPGFLPRTDWLTFLLGTEHAPLAERQRRADRHFEDWGHRTQFPVCVGNEVLFVYRGNAGQVELIGDMTQWTHSLRLRRIEGTDVFYLTQTYQIDARLDYKLIVDGRYMSDPLNPHSAEGGFGANSELRMPGYRPRPELQPQPGVAAGSIEYDSFYSSTLDQMRTYAIYRPAGFNPLRAYRILYFQDGGEYLHAGRAASTLDFVIGSQWIEPVVAVFVDPADRMSEYATNDRYVHFFTCEFLPHVEKQVRTNGRRTLIGDSMGGLISTYLALRYPHLFDSVLSHSGAFPGVWSGGLFYGRPYEIEAFGPRLRHANLPLRFHLVIGSYETDIIGTDYVEANVAVYEALAANPSVRGAELVIHPQGHSWGLWRDTLATGLQHLLQKEPLEARTNLQRPSAVL